MYIYRHNDSYNYVYMYVFEYHYHRYSPSCLYLRARVFWFIDSSVSFLGLHSFSNACKGNHNMSAGPGQGWQSWGASSSSWENTKMKNIEHEGKDCVRLERGQGIVEVRVNGCTEPVFQESTWDEDETMTGQL